MKHNELKKLMDDMLETMYSAPGIGLAAVQVGILKQLIVIDLSKDGEKKNPLFFINPKITFKTKNTSVHEEGCLSLPGYFAEIERPAECHLNYIDYEGKQKKLKAEGLLSTCIQHEVDHLNGILFIDYLSKLKKDMIIKKLVKHKKEIERIKINLNPRLFIRGVLLTMFDKRYKLSTQVDQEARKHFKNKVLPAPFGPKIIVIPFAFISQEMSLSNFLWPLSKLRFFIFIGIKVFFLLTIIFILKVIFFIS